MIAAIEPAAAVLRVFSDDAVPGKDPYAFAATVVYHDFGKTAELRGVVSDGRSNLIQIKRAVFDEFRSCGVEVIQWERRRNGRCKMVSVRI